MKLTGLLTLLVSTVIGSTAFAAKTAPDTNCDAAVTKVATAIGESKGTPKIQDWTILPGKAENQLVFDVRLINDYGFSKTSRVLVTVDVPDTKICEVTNVNIIF